MFEAKGVLTLLPKPNTCWKRVALSAKLWSIGPVRASLRTPISLVHFDSYEVLFNGT